MDFILVGAAEGGGGGGALARRSIATSSGASLALSSAILPDFCCSM